MPVLQMNTRLDAQLKERGDMSLANAGYTPSQAVRMVWEFAAEHAHDPEAVRNFFRASLEERGRQERIDEKLALLDRLEEERCQLEKALGIDNAGSVAPESLSDKELYHEVLTERWEERGLL